MATYGPDLAVGDVMQCVFWMQLGDQAGLNVRHWRVGALSTVGPNQMNRFSDAIAAGGFAASYKALLTNSASFVGFKVRRLQPTLSLEYSFTDGVGAGTAGNSPLPRQVTGFMRLRSMMPGRGLSGRIYVPFPDEADCQPNGKPEDAYMARLDALAANYIQQLNFGTGGVFYPVIYKRPQLHLDPPVGYSMNDVRSVLTVQAFATQRRRGTFGRTNPAPV